MNEVDDLKRYQDEICDVCKQRIGNSHAVEVKQLTDEEDNPIEDGPITWFHKDCLNQRVN